MGEVTLQELSRLAAILQWARGKTFTEAVLDEIVELQKIVTREINLKTQDPRKGPETGSRG